MSQNTLLNLKFSNALIPLRRARKAVFELASQITLKLDANKRRALLQEFNSCVTIEDCIDFTKAYMRVGSCQITSEIQSAIARMAQSRPTVICEIGTFDGGTSLLFSKFLRADLMICIDIYVRNKEMIRLLSPDSLELKFFDAPSYRSSTVEAVSRFLKGRLIDVLFIDGDHRYEGVLQDFLQYRRLVRDGGLIFFHDIVETTGRTEAWAGGVPTLWKELTPHYKHTEFISDIAQEGFGIGMLEYSDAVLPNWRG